MLNIQDLIKIVEVLHKQDICLIYECLNNESIWSNRFDQLDEFIFMHNNQILAYSKKLQMLLGQQSVDSILAYKKF